MVFNSYYFKKKKKQKQIKPYLAYMYIFSINTTLTEDMHINNGEREEIACRYMFRKISWFNQFMQSALHSVVAFFISDWNIIIKIELAISTTWPIVNQLVSYKVFSISTAVNLSTWACKQTWAHWIIFNHKHNWIIWSLHIQFKINRQVSFLRHLY